MTDEFINSVHYSIGSRRKHSIIFSQISRVSLTKIVGKIFFGIYITFEEYVCKNETIPGSNTARKNIKLIRISKTYNNNCSFSILACVALSP